MEKAMNSRIIVDYAKRLNMDIDLDKAELMTAFGRKLLKKNNDINLTAVTDERDFVIKHLCDSITIAALEELSGEVADVGTGGGFPGVVVKIMRPDLPVTLIDSVRKKLAAIEEICSGLGIKVNTIHRRAEELGAGEYRERFDTVTARALAPMPQLLEYCLPLLKKGGFLLAMKGPAAESEINSARRAEKLLKGAVAGIKNFELPGGVKRSVVIYKKIDSIPIEFPRTAKLIKTEPL